MSLIFLSYAVNDDLFVSRLAGDLKALGYEIWEDCISMPPEQTLLERLHSVKRRIDSIILIFSSSSKSGTAAASDWNDVIIDEAIHGRNWLIPIWLQNSELPRHIFPTSVEDFREPSAYSSAFQKLVSRIDSTLVVKEISS
jgi:hypothetical protein